MLRFGAGSIPVTENIFLEDVRTTAYRFCMFFIWYAAGACATSLVPSIVSLSRILWVPLIPLFGALTFVTRQPAIVADLSFALSVVGIIIVIGMAELIARSPRGRKVSRYVAMRTLPIYLLHAYMIVLLKSRGSACPN